MSTPLRCLTVLLLIATALMANPPTAQACSCASADPIDVVGSADVVFTGTVVEQIGSEREPVWEFAVDGVVKGEVSPVETVIGEDWGGGCGTNFGRFSGSIVVFASYDGSDLQAMGCVPTPSADEFEREISQVLPTTGEGPPAAVLSGVVGSSDIAVLDNRGRTIARGATGFGGVVAHCPGTTLAAVVASASRPVTVAIVDLTTFSVLDERPIGIDYVSFARDRVACLDGGNRVVAATGYGPNNGSVRIATSNSPEAGFEDVSKSFSNVSRAVLHPDGAVSLLPSTAGGPLRTVSSDDLQLIENGEVALPDGTSVLDGQLSTNGTLALLATLSGTNLKYDTGATHIVLLDVVDGGPVAESAQVLALDNPGANVSTGNGAARWIHWVDQTSMVVEYETESTKKMEFVSLDGKQITAPTDVGWGWGSAAVQSGVLRARNGGIELVRPDALVTPGDPAPVTDGYVDRSLSLASLYDAGDFTIDVASPANQLTIVPVVADGTTTGEAPATPRTNMASPIEESDETATGLAVPIAIALVVVVALVALGATLVRRKRRH